MPCYDSRDHECVDDSFNVKKLESLLCSACRVLTRTGYDFDENPRLSEWWTGHKVEDNT